MELFSSLTDDQVAVIGCVLAVIASMAVMMMSDHLGKRSQRAAGLKPDLVRHHQEGGTRKDRRAA